MKISSVILCNVCLISCIIWIAVYLLNLKPEIQTVSHRRVYVVKDTCKVCCASASPIVYKNMEAPILIHN